jgi:2-isopropylmalate synthase
VDFSLEDKRLIARTLDQLGVDYIEGGYPGANPTDTELFSADPGLANATFTAFGMTKRSGRSLANDPGFQATLQAKAGAICLVAKAWDYHVRVALGISNEENIEGVAQSVDAVVKAGREPMIDCEHFFDGYKGNRAMPWLSPPPPTRPVRAGSSCATPTAARCRMDSDIVADR